MSQKLCAALAPRGGRPSGASEHVARDLGTSGPWKGLLAFSNIGLAGKAVHGRGWPKHRERLIRLVTELFKASSVHGGGPELLGIFLNEVGNLSDLFDDTAKGKFEDMMREAFARATMDVPQVLWSPGEMMAALRPDVPVECLSRLSHLPRVNSWREVERFTIHGATEHGTCKLLVYNNHQPASDDRPFPANMRIAFCKAIIIDAILPGNQTTEHRIAQAMFEDQDYVCELKPTMRFRGDPVLTRILAKMRTPGDDRSSLRLTDEEWRILQNTDVEHGASLDGTERWYMSAFSGAYVCMA